MWTWIASGIAKKWVIDRLKERTSWNGFGLIALGSAVLLGSSLITWLAWGAIIYGAWQVYQKEFK